MSMLKLRQHLFWRAPFPLSLTLNVCNDIHCEKKHQKELSVTLNFESLLCRFLYSDRTKTQTNKKFILKFFFQEKIAKTACMSSCKHIATRMLDFVMDNEVRTVTLGSLGQFNLDLIQCECELTYVLCQIESNTSSSV